MSDPADMPYIDNFNLINANSMQVSLLPIADTFKCPVSDTYVNGDNYLDFNNQIYNYDLVSIRGNNPVLMLDTVELDGSDVIQEDPAPEDTEEVAFIDSEEFEGDYSF
jgi:monoamine oxidase